jgi:hypothetical protein
LKFPVTTSRERLLRNHWDLVDHGGGKECLPKTIGPGFVSKEDTLGGILFLRLKASHLRPKYRVLNGSHYRCCERRLNCSARRDPGNIILRSRKGCQWLSICWVTLCCEGMTVTSVLETELSSRTKETSMRRLSCGMERGAVSCC